MKIVQLKLKDRERGHKYIVSVNHIRLKIVTHVTPEKALHREHREKFTQRKSKLTYPFFSVFSVSSLRSLCNCFFASGLRNMSP